MSFTLRSQAGLSTAVHMFPRLLEAEARRRTGLVDTSKDLLLRWRAQAPPVGYEVTGNSSWVHLEGIPDADPQRPETWRDVAIGVGATAMEAAVVSRGKPAVAYMPEGDDQLMFGVNELRRTAQMLTRVSFRGVGGQSVYAVKVREGADPVSFAIGYEIGGRYFALPTQQLSPEAVPLNSSLYRV